MKTTILLILLFIQAQLYAQQDWRVIPVYSIDTTNSAEFYDVITPKDSIIIVSTLSFNSNSSGVYRSTNGGLKWSKVLDFMDNNNIELHYSRDLKLCFALYSGYKPLCLRSTDYGSSWDTCDITNLTKRYTTGKPIFRFGRKIDFYHGSVRGLMSVEVGYFNNPTAWSCYLMETTDGGLTWYYTFNGGASSQPVYIFDIALFTYPKGVVYINGESSSGNREMLWRLEYIEGFHPIPQSRDSIYDYKSPLLVLHNPDRFICFKRERGEIYTFTDVDDVANDYYRNTYTFTQLNIRAQNGYLGFVYAADCDPDEQVIYCTVSNRISNNDFANVFLKSTDGGVSFFKIAVPNPILNKDYEDVYSKISVFGKNTVAAVSREKLIISYNGGGNPISTVEDINSSATTFLYPNPAQSTITVTQPGTVYIVDVLGNTVLQEYNVQTTNSISIAHLPLGMYTVCLQGNTLYQVQKLLVVQ